MLLGGYTYGSFPDGDHTMGGRGGRGGERGACTHDIIYSGYSKEYGWNFLAKWALLEWFFSCIGAERGRPLRFQNAPKNVKQANLENLDFSVLRSKFAADMRQNAGNSGSSR